MTGCGVRMGHPQVPAGISHLRLRIRAGGCVGCGTEWGTWKGGMWRGEMWKGEMCMGGMWRA